MINSELLTQTATSSPTSSTKYRQPWATPNVDREAHWRITVLNPLPEIKEYSISINHIDIF